jgi:hypothetical protein
MRLGFVGCGVSQDGFALVSIVLRYVRAAVWVSKRYDTMKEATPRQLAYPNAADKLRTIASCVDGELDHGD